MLEEHGGHGEGEGMWEVGLWEVGAGECGVGVEVEHETSGVCRTGASVMGVMVVSRVKRSCCRGSRWAQRSLGLCYGQWAAAISRHGMERRAASRF